MRQKRKQTWKFEYIGSVLTEDRMVDTEIRSRFRIAMKAFENEIRVLRNRTICLETRRRLLNYLCFSMALGAGQSPLR